MTEIFSTARQVREFYESFSQTNSLLPKAITIAEFESKAFLIPNMVEANEDTRLLLMRESAMFTNFEKLHIPQEFMAFLQNSNYIFRFFEELANEEVDIDELDMQDTYAEFSEHLAILKELLKNYINTLNAKGLYDSITKPKIAKINSSYLASMKEIRIHLEGFLSKFEIRMLSEIEKICHVRIVVPATIYNNKTLEWLKNSGITAKIGSLVECDLNKKRIISSKNIYDNRPIISYQPFSLRVFQAAFVFEKIEEFVKSGILPQNIAVVLPDESFAPILKELDSLNNLNFAMGFGMRFSRYYQRLNSILKFSDDIEHSFRLSRLGLDIFINLNDRVGTEKLMFWLRSFIKEEEVEQSIVENELFLFERFLKNIGTLTYEQAATLFLQRLERQRIDDVNGGKITVIGVLESRGVKYDGVIVVDFNDDVVPKRSSKDMFISSNIRARCNLPSIEDRENLQRFFYDRLINSAKMAAICCVENEDKLPSRFLKSMNVIHEQKDEYSYKDIIFTAAIVNNPIQKSFFQKYNFFDIPLSSSRLKNFLECRRRYYFLYIKRYEEAAIPSNECSARTFGIFIHEFLKSLFKKELTTLENLKKEAKGLMEIMRPKEAIWQLQSDIWLLKLDNFFQNEIKRRDDGWRVFGLEQRIEKECEGFNLEGIIDRIDQKGDEYLLLDYKTGKIPVEKDEERALESCNFQLEFYLLLFGRKAGAAFYDLSNSNLEESKYSNIKKDKLKEHLSFLKREKEFEFNKTDDIKKCQFCYFKELCGNML